ncbi:DUF3135 domain-containing protein [Marinobacter sp.]|uniref:DUF3135 domain-containing protein n=1 Tax=Marinobacter sp. TaxID=50741 RepID=UPI003569DF7E
MDMPTFERLRTLAERDPAGFETLRSELIEDCISQSSPCHQSRLRGLQFVIDARRRVAGSPVKALVEIQAMMYDSFLELRLALRGQRRPAVLASQGRAKVLALRRPSR